MARGRAKWKRHFEIKTYLSSLLTAIEDVAPAVTRRLGYHARFHFPDRGFARFEEARVPSRMAEPAYAEALRTLSVANVDKPTGQLGHAGHSDPPGGPSPLGALAPLEARRISAIGTGVRVPGHSLLPFDGRSGRLLSVYFEGRADWGLAYVAPSALRRVRVPGYAWAIPRIGNYYHLMVEHILPVADWLLRHPGEVGAAPVTLITAGPQDAVRAFVEILAGLGLRIEILTANALTTYAPDHYLYCRPVAASVEHLYAYRPCVEALRAGLLRAGRPTGPERLYVPRTGTRVRRLLGEAELVGALEARGFQPFTARWGNVREQVARFLAAREIVSVHGAALTNLVWAAPGARIVELFPANARKTTYLHMASQHDQGYACAIGGRENERQDFPIDPRAVLGIFG